MAAVPQEQRIAVGIEALLESYARLIAFTRTGNSADDRAAVQARHSCVLVVL